MKSAATDRVDGRFAQDNGLAWNWGKREEPVIFAEVRSHAASGDRRGAAQLGPDRGRVGVHFIALEPGGGLALF